MLTISICVAFAEMDEDTNLIDTVDSFFFLACLGARTSRISLCTFLTSSRSLGSLASSLNEIKGILIKL